jgi:hypothetical protein
MIWISCTCGYCFDAAACGCSPAAAALDYPRVLLIYDSVSC